jgi:uncharacterized protein with von Willebrand factor type A (vWA) domain
MKRLAMEVSRWSTMIKRWVEGDPLPRESDTPAAKWEDEVFCRLYDHENRWLPEERGDGKWTKWSRKFHRMAEQVPEWAQLESDCEGNLLRSSVSTQYIYEHLKDLIEEEQKDGGGGGEGQDGKDLRQKVKEAIQGAAKASDDAQEMAEAFGPQPGSAMGNPTGSLSKEQVKAWMETLKKAPHLKKLAEIAGRFRRIAHNTRKTRVKHAADEVEDVEIGNDLSKLLPQEAQRLRGSRGSRLSFFADYASGKLMQYRIGGYDRKGMGPMIVCIDKSGSMNGDPDMWATSVAMALMSLAQKDRRPFVLVPFMYGPVKMVRVEPGEAIPLDDVLIAANGGTSIDKTLKACLDYMKKEQSEHGLLRKADIVLITDGEDGTSFDAKAEADALDTRIVGIGIGVPAGALNAWAHESAGVENLQNVDDDIAQMIFAEKV